MEQYLDRVGSLDADELEDKSMKDVKKYLKNEVADHQETIAQRIEDQVNKGGKFMSLICSYLSLI